jgi:hypothetical protein
MRVCHHLCKSGREKKDAENLYDAVSIAFAHSLAMSLRSLPTIVDSTSRQLIEFMKAQASLVLVDESTDLSFW